jgi:cobalamin transport system substrate-binding protein
MIFAAGCGAKIVGTDNFSDYPDAVKSLPKVGGVEPDVEKIAALHPDLVIASSSNVHPNLRRAISAIHVPLLVIETNRLSEITSGVAAIQQRAECKAAVTMTAALEQQRRKRTKSARVMFIVWPNPLYAAGRSTYIDDLFALTGARNAVDSNGWPQLSLETFATHPPDLLLYPRGSVMPAAVADLTQRAHVKVDAVAVDANIFSRPGPRVVNAAEELNRILDQWERSH